MNDSFQFLTSEDRHLFESKAERRIYAADESILAEGSTEQAIFLIRRGTVRVERDHLGSGVPFARLEAGEVFGEMSFLENTGASASVVADERVEVDVIDGPHVQALLVSVPGLATRFYQSLAVALSARLRQTSYLACPPMCWG